MRVSVAIAGSLLPVLPPGYRFSALGPADAAALADAYRRNREHLRRWEPTRDESFFTAAGQAAVIADQMTAARQGLLAAWLVVHEGAAGEQVVGRFNLNNIVRGVLCSASVGYWVDEAHQGRGLATAALELTCAQALARGLHRVEASTQLGNVVSQRVLERCGFEEYGLAPRFLFIGGEWRDCRLYQRILHDRPLRVAGVGAPTR
jgi:ribosomal-protein-alanine N-acetyltransferase